MTTSTVTLRRATAEDRGAVEALPEAAEFTREGLDAHFGTFTVAGREGEVIGAIGIEPYGPDALVRSLVIAEALRGHGLGTRMLRALAAEAASGGCHTLYLRTETAPQFFTRFGFTEIDPDEVPEAVLQSSSSRAPALRPASRCPAPRGWPEATGTP